jgi:hypothetical protein
VEPLVRAEQIEDLGQAGDLPTDLTIDQSGVLSVSSGFKRYSERDGCHHCGGGLHRGQNRLSTRETSLGLRAFKKCEMWGATFTGSASTMPSSPRKVMSRSLGVAEALRRPRAADGHLVKIEVEVDSLDRLREALAEGADDVLLDNMRA